MSVNAETPIASSTANGVTTSFPYAFTVLSAADLVVQGVLSGITTVYTYGVHYTLTGLGTDAGSVEFLSPPANGTVITRYRSSELKRTTDYQDNGDLLAKTVNVDFDRLWLALQEINSGGGGGGGGGSGGAGALKTDLANAMDPGKGASMVGYNRLATGSVPSTVAAKLARYVDVRDFGVKGDGTDETAKLQAAFDSGLAIDLLGLTIKHAGIVVTSPGGLRWRGNGATLHYTGAGTGVRITSAAATDISGVDIEGVTFKYGQCQLWIQGDAASKAKIADIRLERCGFAGEPASALNAGLTVLYCERIEVSGCAFRDCTDNGPYVAFSRRVNLHHNFIHNCRGSGGITVGYSDTIIGWMAEDIVVDSNIVFNDDSAAAGAYIAGIDVVFASGVRVSNNVIANRQASKTVTTSIKSGITVEEWQCSDIVISNNTIVSPLENLLRIGTNPNSELRRLRVTDNYGYDSGLAGLRIDACVEGLEVSRNTIDTTGQEAIWIGPRCTADSKVHANVLRHPACQLAFANTAAIKIEGLNCTVTDNTIDSGHVSINVTSSVAAPGVSVDPATTTITLYSGVTALASKNYAGLTFGDVAEWVRTNANWDATMYGEPNAPYVSATDYSPNNVVTHGGRVYRNIARSKFIAPVASWSAATTYALNDKVLCAGSIYVSLAAGNVGNDPLMTPAKWSAYYPPAWSAGTSYAAGDTVSYAGGFMRSLQPGNLGNDPGSSPTFWTWGALLYWVPMAIDGAAMLPAAKYLRRTGERSGSIVRTYALDALGRLKLTSSECYIAIYTAWPSKGNCRVSGNTLNSDAFDYLGQSLGTVQPFFLGNAYLFEKPDTLADVLENGGGRAFVGSALNGQLTPASLPTNRYYLSGDTFVSSNPALMPGRYTCVTPGFGTNAVWKPYTGTGVGLVTPIANGARATTTVAVLPVLVGAENQVTVTIDVDAKGLKVFGYVSASGVVTVVYENHTGGSVTLSAHTLRVYVS